MIAACLMVASVEQCECATPTNTATGVLFRGSWKHPCVALAWHSCAARVQCADRFHQEGRLIAVAGCCRSCLDQVARSVLCAVPCMRTHLGHLWQACSPGALVDGPHDLGILQQLQRKSTQSTVDPVSAICMVRYETTPATAAHTPSLPGISTPSRQAAPHNNTCPPFLTALALPGTHP